jgi:hypothetical protein
MLKVQVGAVTATESRTLLNTIWALTRPIVTRRFGGPKRCTRTQKIGIRITSGSLTRLRI